MEGGHAMPKTTRSRRASNQSLFRKIVRELAGENLLLGREGGWLVLLSVADLLVTYALLRQGAHFYESNPIAQWWFARWNMAGMTAYKFLVVGSVIAICEIVERRRPNLGRAVLWAGSLAAAGVVLYSVYLFAQHA
jgi:hypothetical protein